MSDKCPKCGKESEWLSQHWIRSKDCSHPEIGDKRHRIIKGALMGDGYIQQHSKNASLVVQSTTKEYLEHLRSVFGPLSTEVRFSMSAEQSATRSINNESRGDTNISDHSDVYVWSTRCHPDLNRYRDWYEENGKVWPEDLFLHPSMLKHLYVCDGNYDDSGSHNRIRISMSNEIENMRKVENIFSRSGIEISHWDTSERKDGSKRCLAVIASAEQKGVFDYMGEPIPGFSYKWP